MIYLILIGLTLIGFCFSPLWGIFFFIAIPGYAIWGWPALAGVGLSILLVFATKNHMGEHKGHTHEGPYDPRNDY